MGAAMVWAVAVGMFLLVAWRVIEVVADHEWGSGLKAVLYAAIGVSAVQVALGDGSKGGTDSWTARLMDMPGGQLLVGALGLGILAYGGAQVRKGWTEGFRKDLEAEATQGRVGSAYLLFGKIGYTAKGIAVAVVGGLFCWAALEHEAKKSGGLDVALQTVLDAPFGQVLLGAIALGIVCYGAFSLARAKHLRT
jgi:hypothetical protein